MVEQLMGKNMVEVMSSFRINDQLGTTIRSKADVTGSILLVGDYYQVSVKELGDPIVNCCFRQANLLGYFT